MQQSSNNNNNNDMDSVDDGEIYLAAIEGGGTTFVVSVARVVKQRRQHGAVAVDRDATLLQIGPTTLEILHTATFPPKDAISGIIPTWTPKQILDAVGDFLIQHRPSSSSISSDQLATHNTTATVPAATRRYSAVGIATFGPAGVHPHKPNYGTILAGSPKKEWRNVDILTPIREACGFSNSNSRVKFDTDVNAPALAEFRHRCYLQQQQQLHRRQHHPSSEPQEHPQSSHKVVTTTTTTPLTSLAYVTIGTGVGVGLIINSAPVHGLLHPEGGHVAICPLDPNDSFTGYSWGRERSPYGGVNTVEGVASSVALTERYIQMNAHDDDANVDDNNNTDDDTDRDSKMSNSDNAQTRELLSTLPDSHPIWSHAANAVANLCVSLLLLNSIQKIVLGGGIMKRSVLYSMVRQRVWTILNGYLDCVEELSDVQKLDDVIVEGCWIQTNNLGSGLVGAYALALDAYGKHEQDGKELERECV